MSDFIPPAIEPGLDEGRKSSTLAFALFCLPRDRRADMRDYYRFCRILDDIADSPTVPRAEKRSALDAWRSALDGDRPLPGFLSHLNDRYALDLPVLREIVAGMEMDIEGFDCETFDDLRTYCWRVASAVGIGCLPILGADRDRSRDFAENLGIALQLVNILRDVGEDLQNGRVYLPAEDIKRFGLSRETLVKAEATPAFRSLLQTQADRARRFFAHAEANLPSPDRRALLAPRIMMTLYRTLLDRMERDGFRTISHRYRLPRPAKLLLAARTMVS